MVSAINTALSGLSAATRRLEVSANNIANQNSTQTNTNGEVSNTPFTPQRVDLVSLSNSGVIAQVRNQEPATTQVPNAESETGLIEVPNVDVARELVEVKLASYDYKANIKVIKTQNELEQNLLDILS